MVIRKDFNVLETDIEKISAEIAEKKKLLEHKDVSERELIKQSIKASVQVKQQLTTDKDKNEDKNTNFAKNFLPDYFKDVKNLPPETKSQIELLIDLTLHQGIDKTVHRAQRFNPFIIDAFHDILTDKLHEELKKRNLL